MTTATKTRDKPHARIYAAWLLLTAWRNLTAHARALLVEMFAEYRPGLNGLLEWPQSRVAALLHCGNVKARDTLVELEKAGWIEVTRVGSFSGPRQATRYRLTWYSCDVTGDPASAAFLKAFVPPPKVIKRNRTGANQNRVGFYQTGQRVPDRTGEPQASTPVQITDALRNALMRKGLIPKTRVKAK